MILPQWCIVQQNRVDHVYENRRQTSHLSNCPLRDGRRRIAGKSCDISYTEKLRHTAELARIEFTQSILIDLLVGIDPQDQWLGFLCAFVPAFWRYVFVGIKLPVFKEIN